MNNGERHEGSRRGPGETLDDVLASIRALVTAETSSRMGVQTGENNVLMLTPDMRVDDEDDLRPEELLSSGLDLRNPTEVLEDAPILDEEAIRRVVNRIVREELQGELGDRISRNLRKLIRREIGQVLEHDRLE